MATKQEEHFQAALKMIQVTPENFDTLKADMILHVCKVIAEADAKQTEPQSIHAGKTKEQILKEI